MSQDFNWLESKWITVFNWCRLAHFQIQNYLSDVLEHLILFLVLYIISCIALYFLIMHWRVIGFQRDVKHANRILFVIAHPDDETMFFGPTVLHFTQRNDCSVYIMCLSTGRNYGMGQTRKKELYAACNILGIKEECVILHNHSLLPDAMDVHWPPEIVAQLILQQIEAYAIDTLITFDKHGISRHVNHCSIYYAVAHLSTGKKIPDYCKVYVLESVNIVRKFWLFLDIPICYILSRIRFITNIADRKVLYKAMQQHRSQFVWFRRLYMHFSRYQLINTLQKMDKIDIELDLEVDD